MGYTYKELLYALREEYLKQQDKLNKLTDHFGDKKKDKLQVELYKINNEKQLKISETNPSLFYSIVGELKAYQTEIACDIDGTSTYLIRPDRTRYPLSEEEIKSLILDSYKILESEFVKYMQMKHHETIGNGIHVKTNLNNFHTKIDTRGDLYDSAVLIYEPTKDVLSVAGYDVPINNYSLNHIFDAEVNIDSLPKYQQKIIKARPFNGDAIILNLNSKSLDDIYKISEDENNLLFDRKR